MRTRIWLFSAIVFVVCCLLVLLQNRRHEHSFPKETAVTIGNQPEHQNTLENRQTPIKPNSVTKAHPRRSEFEITNAIYQQMQADWQKPIDFYGKVLDESNNPIADVTIQFQWADMTENVSSNAITAKSDANGAFALHGKSGRSLEVIVSKEGYYASHGGYMGFLYSLGSDIYLPDPQNPVIFKMHKMGRNQTTKLITSENGNRLKVDVRIPKNNTPVRVDLLQKQCSPEGQLEISQIKPPWQTATNWSFRMSIPNGGFVENEDEFQFEAPDTNYQQTIEYHFEKSDTNWCQRAVKTSHQWADQNQPV